MPLEEPAITEDIGDKLLDFPALPEAPCPSRVRNRIEKAYDPAEKGRLLATAKLAAAHILPALMLEMNTGMRGPEIKNLAWGQVDLTKRYLAVGRSKTDAGEGWTIPLNSALQAVLVEYGVVQGGLPQDRSGPSPHQCQCDWPMARQPAYAGHGFG